LPLIDQRALITPSRIAWLSPAISWPDISAIAASAWRASNMAKTAQSSIPLTGEDRSPATPWFGEEINHATSDYSQFHSYKDSRTH
jgi:hypothetical protein